MQQKMQSVTLATAMVFLLSACGPETPKCSDEDTFKLVRKIVLDQIGGSGDLSEKEIKDNLVIELPRASSFDEKINKYSCEANLIAGGSYQVPITYESQLDDKKQHVVVVNGMLRGDLQQIFFSMNAAIQKNRPAAAPAAATQPPTVAQPPVAPAPAPTSQPAATAEQAHVPPSPAAVPAPAPTVEAKSWNVSFDCAKAATPTEKVICSDRLLGSLDGALAENYKYMIASDIGDGARKDLKTTQKQWLADRNKCADNAACLADAYRKRLDEVCEYPVISGTHPACTHAIDVK